MRKGSPKGEKEGVGLLLKSRFKRARVTLPLRGPSQCEIAGRYSRHATYANKCKRTRPCERCCYGLKSNVGVLMEGQVQVGLDSQG